MAGVTIAHNAECIVIPEYARQEREKKDSPIEKTKNEDHNFISSFIAFTTVTLDLAIICLDSVTSSIA
jgi:hypothetical protein